MYLACICVIVLITFLIVIDINNVIDKENDFPNRNEFLNITFPSVKPKGEFSPKNENVDFREPSDAFKKAIIDAYIESTFSPDEYVKYLESNNPKIFNDISKENLLKLIIIMK